MGLIVAVVVDVALVVVPAAVTFLLREDTIPGPLLDRMEIIRLTGCAKGGHNHESVHNASC